MDSTPLSATTNACPNDVSPAGRETPATPSGEQILQVALHPVPQGSLLTNAQPAAPEASPHFGGGVRRPATQLTHQQRVAIELLAIGQTDAAVAAALGMHSRSIARWRRERPLFKAELERRRDQVWSEASDQLRAMINDALRVFERDLHDANPAVSHRTAFQALKLAKLGPRIWL
jgi:hypothetical protein